MLWIMSHVPNVSNVIIVGLINELRFGLHKLQKILELRLMRAGRGLYTSSKRSLTFWSLGKFRSALLGEGRVDETKQ